MKRNRGRSQLLNLAGGDWGQIFPLDNSLRKFPASLKIMGDVGDFVAFFDLNRRFIFL